MEVISELLGASQRDKGFGLGAGDWELPAARNGLNDDVCFSYAEFQELSFGAGEEGLNNCWRCGN